MRDITLCRPRVQDLAAKLVDECSKHGLKIKTTETLRTVAEQDDLYAQGRTKPGKIVTNAKGSSYSSYHQWGTAFDYCRNDGKGAYNELGDFFNKVGKIGLSLGLEWGGNWKSPVDKPHFQLPDWGSRASGIKKLYKTPEEFIHTWQREDHRGGWINDHNGWWYRRADGSYPANKWCVINNHWYLFNKDGYMCTNWHRWNGVECDPVDGGGDWYYFDSTANGAEEGVCWHSNDKGAQSVWCVELADDI